MAVNDNATLVIGSGNYLIAPVSTAIPLDLTAPDAPWAKVGHTSLEDVFNISSEGGEATVLGTLQNKNLRTRYSPRSETMTFTLQQFDADSLKLYFGSNMVDDADGFLGVPENPTPAEHAFLAVFIDGSNVFAFYAPKAEVFRGDDMSLSDTESLAGLPLNVKPLVVSPNTWAYKVTPLAAV